MTRTQAVELIKEILLRGLPIDETACEIVSRLGGTLQLETEFAQMGAHATGAGRLKP